MRSSRRTERGTLEVGVVGEGEMGLGHADGQVGKPLRRVALDLLLGQGWAIG
jgi:hypothetical protein